MKKLFALLAVAIGVVACQKDQADFGVNLGGEQEATINVSLPEETRADSALSGLDNGVLTDHDLRFILEIYSGDQCVRQEKIVEDGITSASFNVRVVPKHEYDFVVWADFVKNDVDTYYNTHTKDANGKDLGLQNISIIDDAPMTEARDAFYGKASLGTEDYVANMGAITLKRPFAKIRVIADDVDAAKAVLHKSLTAATVTYKNDVTLYNTFNARTKVVSGDAAKVKNITYPSVYDESNLYVDYLLVPQGEQSIVKFDLEVADFVHKDFSTDIAVEANKLTTIKGDILTNGSDIKVEIEDGMAAETIYLEGNVTLTEDLVVSKSMLVREGATAVINLNGNDIIIDTDSEELEEGDGIIVYGNLTIEGEGNVRAKTRAIWARGNTGAVVTINGGNYVGADDCNSSVIYASGNGKVVINGGTFKALHADKTSYANKTEGVYAALNVADRQGMIEVKGGSFYKQNPAVPGTEPADWNAAHPNGFLAEGCVSVANGEWFDVINDPYYYYTKVNNADELARAFTEGKSEIFLNSGNYEGTFKVTRNVKIVGADNAKIIGRVEINPATATFENVKFDTNDASKAAFTLTGWSGYQYEAIVGIGTSGSASFDNCSFNYQDTSAITNANGFVKVTNCDFVGNSQFAIYSRANIEITNSTVNVTVPDGYENIAGFIHLNALANGKTTVKNITGSCHNGANMGFIICFGSTNNDANGVWVGPVTFDVQGNTGFTYPFYKLNSVTISHEDHIFADGSKKFTWTY